jgi:hypothetical protein
MNERATVASSKENQGKTTPSDVAPQRHAGIIEKMTASVPLPSVPGGENRMQWPPDPFTAGGQKVPGFSIYGASIFNPSNNTSSAATSITSVSGAPTWTATFARTNLQPDVQLFLILTGQDTVASSTVVPFVVNSDGSGVGWSLPFAPKKRSG